MQDRLKKMAKKVGGMGSRSARHHKRDAVRDAEEAARLAAEEAARAEVELGTRVARKKKRGAERSSVSATYTPGRHSVSGEGRQCESEDPPYPYPMYPAASGSRHSMSGVGWGDDYMGDASSTHQLLLEYYGDQQVGGGSDYHQGGGSGHHEGGGSEFHYGGGSGGGSDYQYGGGSQPYYGGDHDRHEDDWSAFGYDRSMDEEERAHAEEEPEVEVCIRKYNIVYDKLSLINQIMILSMLNMCCRASGGGEDHGMPHGMMGGC